MLQIKLLGAPTVTWHGRELKLPRRAVRAMLYALAATDGAIARDQLACLLHGDAAGDQALPRVRMGLAQLRDSLAVAGAPKDLVIATAQSAALSDAAAVDVRRIDALGRRREALDDADLAFLQQAYRGDFLAGFGMERLPEFDAWQSAERERWLRAYIDVAQRASCALAADKRFQPARALLQELVRVDPLNEDAHALLIDCYRELGERAAAMRQYEQLRARLERELGVMPLPETEARYRRLFAPAPAPTVNVPQASAPAGGGALPFVGREGELKQFSTIWQRALSGRPQVIVLCGDAGAGKSRLAAECVSMLPWPALLRAQCHASTQSTPYQALSDALQDMMRAQPRADARPWKRELLRVLARQPGATPVAAMSRNSRNEAEARGVLWRAAQHAVTLAARSRPLVILGDDMQWCDNETVSLLAHVLRRVRHAPLLAVFTLRDGPSFFADALHELARHSDGVVGGPDVTRIPVGALKPADLRALVTQADGGLDDTRSGALAQALFDETEGNAFFAVETLRSWLPLRPQDHDGSAKPSNIPLPAAIREFIESRFARLSSRARQVLGAAAVVGRSVSHDTLQAVTGLGENELADVLDELIAARIVHDGEHMRFAHGKFQEVAYDSLSVVRRRQMHARAAAALMAAADAERRGFEIVEHAEHGRLWPASGAADAARWYALAGRSAQDACATARAVTLYRKALNALGWRDAGAGGAGAEAAPALVQQLSQDQLRTGMDVFAGLGEMLRWQADYNGALDAFAAMRILAGAAGDALSAARGLQGAAFVLNYKGDHAAAIAHAQQAADMARPLLAHDVLTATSYDQGWAHFRLGQYLQALECAGRTIALSEARNDDYQLSLGFNLLGVTYNNLGDFAQARAAHERGLTLCRALNLRARMMSVLTNLGELARAQGDFAEAAERHAEALALGRDMESREMQRLAHLNLGATNVGLNRAADAESSLRSALALIDEQGWTGESEARCFLAEALSCQGRHDAALAEAERALALAHATGRPANVAEAWHALGMAQSRAARSAVDSFAESVKIYRQHYAPAPLARALHAWSWHAATSGDAAQASELQSEALQIAARIGLQLTAVPHKNSS